MIRPKPILALTMAVVLQATSSYALETAQVPLNSLWLYEDTGTDLMTAWRAPGYVDTGWLEGQAPLGYGEPYIQTPVSFGGDSTNKHITTYFRKTFALVGDPAAATRLIFDARYDDGVVVYLNGVEMFRSPSLPDTNIVYSTTAALHEGGETERYIVPAPPSLLVAGANVLAAEVHQNHRTSSDLVFDLAFTTSDDPSPLVRGPYLQRASSDSIAIRWRTVAPSESWVRYGSDPEQLATTTMQADPTVEHEILLGALSPATRYFYSIGTADSTYAGGDSLHAFRTAPPVGSHTPVRTWFLGDSGLPGPNQLAVRDAYRTYAAEQPADLWIMLGDNAYPHGTDAQYQEAVFDVFDQMLPSTPLWVTRGNHDLLHSGTMDDYFDLFTLPTQGQAGGTASGSEAYYSFDWANIHFICLDSFASDRDPAAPMLTWLAEDLANTDQDWIIAFFHHPPYSKGGHDSDTEVRLIEMRANALPILEDGGVDLVVAGHSHSYERSVLLSGHYDVSDSLQPSMILDGGDGRRSGDGAYVKPMVSTDHEGAVHAIVGSSSRVTSGPLNHPIMVESMMTLGSMVMDVEGMELNAVFLSDSGSIPDAFTIVKGTTTSSPAAPSVALRAGPNPFSARTRILFSLPRAGRARVEIYDLAGRRVATPLDEQLPSGTHTVWWSGRDRRGAAVSAGQYLTRLVLDGQVLDQGKLLLVR